MGQTIFHSASERIAFSEAVDFIEQGRVELVPNDRIQQYVDKGLLARDGDELTLTEEGRRQHDIALRERFTDG